MDEDVNIDTDVRRGLGGGRGRVWEGVVEASLPDRGCGGLRWVHVRRDVLTVEASWSRHCNYSRKLCCRRIAGLTPTRVKVRVERSLARSLTSTLNKLLP